MRRAKGFLPVIVVLVLGVSTHVFAQDALKGAAADLEKGWQSLDVPLLEKALKVFEEQAKKDPKDHLAPYYAAKAHFAIADCLDIKSDEEFDKTGKGDTHIDAALELIKTSLSAKEDYVDSYILKYQVLRRKMFRVGFPGLMMYIGDRQAAFNKAKELAPGSEMVDFMSAVEVAEGGPPPPPEKPIKAFTELLQKHPKMADAYYEMGAVWERANKKPDAKTNYEKALELNPNHNWAKKKLKGLGAG
jgi:tetratricopeptide (TPR) repeat protein